MNSTLLEFPYAGLSIEVVDEFTEEFMIYPTLVLEVCFHAGYIFGKNKCTVYTLTDNWDQCVNSLMNLEGLGKVELHLYYEKNYYEWGYPILTLRWEYGNRFCILMDETDLHYGDASLLSLKYEYQISTPNIDSTIQVFKDFPKWW